ncbi:MAG: hypothetical protein J07HN4v3_02494 [Halonotius sp. J07HN4]|nr:MAG: hypothetical protein J07HN4v3_02494 [Halonotius sp. J07HN4]
MDRYTLIVVIANLTILLASGTVVVLARRAFARTGIGALRIVAVGFAVIGVGAAGHSYLSVVGSRLSGIVAQSTTALGVVIVCYSLYRTTSAPTESTVS